MAIWTIHPSSINVFWQNKCLCCHGLSHDVIFLSKSIFLAEILTRTQAGRHDSVLEEKNNDLEGMGKEKDGLRGGRTQDLGLWCLFCPTEAVIPFTNHPSCAGEQCSLQQPCKNADEPSAEILLRHPQDRENLPFKQQLNYYLLSKSLASDTCFQKPGHRALCCAKVQGFCTENTSPRSVWICVLCLQGFDCSVRLGLGLFLPLSCQISLRRCCLRISFAKVLPWFLFSGEYLCKWKWLWILLCLWICALGLD